VKLRAGCVSLAGPRVWRTTIGERSSRRELQRFGGRHSQGASAAPPLSAIWSFP
jgi:hypothetical protein